MSESPARIAPRALVVMGASGSGKSTLAQALARRLGWRFVEGDDLHPQANVDKMAAGVPLDDADREPWLDRVGAALAEPPDAGVVAACSALRRRYRDRLRIHRADTVFVLQHADRATLAARLLQRRGHFMPASLLDSQLAALEPPGAGEAALTVDATATVEAQVERVLCWLASTASVPA